MTTNVSETMKALRNQFVAQLTGRIDAIREQHKRLTAAGWTTAEAETLHRLAHSLTGSAGTFGMPSLSAVARDLEERLARHLKSSPTGGVLDEAAWAGLAAGVDRLRQVAHMHLTLRAPNLKPLPANVRVDRVPLVYLVEDDVEQAAYIGQVLREAGYGVQAWHSAEDFRAAMAGPETERPAAVVMDMVFPEGDHTGAVLIEECGLGRNSGIPVVAVSALDDLHARLRALRAGVCRCLTKPVQPAQLVDLLDALTGRQTSEPYRVLLVDDDPLLLETHAAILREAGMEVLTLGEPLLTFDRVASFSPDVLLLDVYMPQASGPELAAVLRERDDYLHLPILFLSAEDDMSQQLLALNLGGDDFLTKPILAEHLVASVTARARRQRQSNAIRQRLQTTLYERQREHLALDRHAIVSITDASGAITYVNDRFCEVSGYRRDELLGQNHRILKSGKHPPEFYRELWQTISGGSVWQGKIRNRRKDGSFYWVESTITPFVDGDGLPYQYVSIRTDITHVKESEHAAEVAKELLRRGQLYANIGTWEWNLVTGALFWTERIASLFGYPLGDLETSYDNFLASVHPDDRQAVIDAVGACVERDVPYEIEHRVVWPDGTVRWLLERGAVQRDAEGNPLQMIGVVQDIDDRKRAELTLAVRTQQLNEAQALAHVGSWRLDVATDQVIWSKELYKMYGFDPSLPPSPYTEHKKLFTPASWDRLEQSLNRAVETGTPYELELETVRKDGTTGWMWVRGEREDDKKGAAIALKGVAQDITERKRAELALAERERLLLEEAQKLAHIGNWSADLVTGELLWSAEIYRIFGHEPGSFAPNTAAFHAAVHPDDRELVLASEKKAQTTGRHNVVHRIVRPDGSVRHVHELAQMHLDEAGKPLRLTGTVQDVTERVAFEQALMAAREAADRANQAKSEFLSSMSHELRTPMNAILGFGQLMEYDDTLPAEHQDNVKEILKAGQHLLELINEVLDLAKVESGKVDLSLEPVAVDPVIRECLSLIGTLADKRRIQISHHGLKNTVARADRTRLKQVLLNLLSNAVKYNRVGGCVRIEVQSEGSDRLSIRVTDTGPGIPADRLAELFQPFNRLDAKDSEIEGTGIGLTITQRIVETMGGTVDVESTVGVGSSFWIELPREAVEDAAGAQAGAVRAGEPARTPGALAKHTVLYIEDNPANLKLVAQILGRVPHIHLLTAHAPEQGIDLALARRPALILLDINMPGMDGYQVLQVFKAQATLKGIPVVAITANAMPRDIERGKAAGFVDYLTKPLDVPRFIDTVNRCLTGNTP
jgi:PAS domain S-box-containing protein